MNKLITKIIPGKIKKKVFNTVKSHIKESNLIESKQIPKYRIGSRNIENAKMLINREELLKCLPQEGIAAELGVDEGNFSEMIFKTCKLKKLHLVDFWGSQRYNKKKRIEVEEKFKNQIKNGKVEINLGLSTEVGNHFEDDYFDWIYIDTDHSYTTTIKELEIWRPKVKENGIIAGHDYIIGNWNSMVRYGVKEAVYEFCSKYGWELIYLSMELDNHPSYAIRKINRIAYQA